MVYTHPSQRFYLRVLSILYKEPRVKICLELEMIRTQHPKKGHTDGARRPQKKLELLFPFVHPCFSLFFQYML